MEKKNRLDKYILAIRLFKTRSQAEACEKVENKIPRLCSQSIQNVSVDEYEEVRPKPKMADKSYTGYWITACNTAKPSSII